jgi:hypothetical protein
MARKTGMDEALRRFGMLDRPDGVILCLDADCTVRKDYLESVFNELFLRKNRSACSIYFEHPISGTEFSENSYMAITLYELHLRYYCQALRFSGFPYVFHTVGSAMAVKALPYMKSGGMNRKQAGEDFYFIQKLVPAGGYFNLNSTVVYPSPRTSFRVPFGTGATMERLSREKNPVLLTYNPEAFFHLKEAFSLLDEFYGCADEDYGSLYARLPEGLRSFSDEEEWTGNIAAIKRNTSSIESFRKRFFSWFNMFKVVKYLNHVHQNRIRRIQVEAAASELLRELEVISGNDAAELLRAYRTLERNQ